MLSVEEGASGSCLAFSVVEDDCSSLGICEHLIHSFFVWQVTVSSPLFSPASTSLRGKSFFASSYESSQSSSIFGWHYHVHLVR